MSSFLSSVLSSIGNGGGQSQPPSQSRPPAPTAPSSATGPAAQPLRTNGTNDRGPPAPPPAPPPKRKAESDAEAARAKAPRKEVLPARPSPAPRTATSSPLPRPTTKPPVPSSSSNTIPYRGTAQPSGPVNNARKIAPSTASAASKPSVSVGASKPVLNKPATTAAAVKPTSSAPPKKGSFQEIMARAKAAQEASRSVGAIKHKPVGKMSKKEKLAHEAEAKAKQGTGPPPRTGQKGQAKVLESKNTKPSEPEKKKSADLGYQGTMRPSPREPTYQGTMNKGPALKSRSGSYDRSRSASLGARPPPKRYNYYEDDEMEEEEDYDSESDMEAGVFDVDREEQEALRIARREDELALKEEEELKRKKLERKKIMDAKKRRA